MNRIFRCLETALLLAVLISSCVSKSPEGDANASAPYSNRIHTPEEELAGFTLPDGFVAELVASEREGIVNPVDLTFDDAGRLWTQTARMYPLDPLADVQWNDLLKLLDDQETQQNHPAFKRVLDLFQGRAKGTDQVLVLTDFYGKKGTANVSVWADSLTIPMSIMPYKTGVYVAQGSELFFLDDTDGDGKSDNRTPLITGFGFTDTHTMAHSLVRGPGGWMYFSHGALNKGEVTSVASGEKLRINFSKIVRFSMDDAKSIELVACGLNNIWGFQLRHNGQWYATEANDLGYTTVPLERGAAFPGIGNDRLREYQPFMPALHKFRVGGTGLSGLAFSDDKSGTFPDEWKDVALLANPITSTINAVQVVRNPDGSVTNKHLPDLLTSKDKYFRPVNIEFGPDGCLYIADWYNKIISHNEVPTSHPERDKSHGRIWRIRHVSQKPRDIVNFYEVPSNELVKYLQSQSLWERRSAWHQIADRPKEKTAALIPELVSLAGDATQDESTRVHAIWCLEALGHFDARLFAALLAAPEHNVRREAVRSLISFDLSAAEASDAVGGLIDDPNPMIRSQVIRTLASLSEADLSTIAILVHACKPELQGNEMGGPYERRFERFLALMALEQYPHLLREFIRAPGEKGADPVKLLWAIRALPPQQMEELFPSIWTAAGLTDLDESNFITVSKMLGNTKIYTLMKPVLEDQRHAERYLRFAVDNQQIVQSERLAAVLKLPAENLLETGTMAQKYLALDVMGRYKMKPTDAVVAMVTDTAGDKTINLVIKVLEHERQKNSAAFVRIAQNTNIKTDLRLSALHNLCKSDNKKALAIAGDQVESFDNIQKKALASALSSSKEGSTVLTSLYGNKRLTADAFDLASAERISENTANPIASEILDIVKGQMEEEKKSFDAKLARYVSMVEQNTGDPGRGKELFKTCLMCHRVGDQGQNIAPALDGSAARDTEALLTAILDPAAAIERAYAIFHITRKDNTSVEGYLVQRDGNGTTIAFMGGNELFVPIEDIKQQGYHFGRSFMPRGLIDGYTETQVADLLAYIGTLK